MKDMKNAHKILRKSQWKKYYLTDIDIRLQTQTEACYISTALINIRQAQLLYFVRSYMFQPFQTVIIRSSNRSSQQMLCARWDHNVFTSIKYIKYTKLYKKDRCVLCNTIYIQIYICVYIHI